MLKSQILQGHASRVALSALILCLCPMAHADAPAAAQSPTTAQLQQQVEELGKQLALVQNSSDPAARQLAMQRHWSMMQEHVRSARMMPGMRTHGCVDWMMMDPHMLGHGMMGQSSDEGCRWMGHGMMGMGSMGTGMMGSGQEWWGMPSGMQPERYGRQMQGIMQQMHQQMAGIAAEKDPAKRQALIREHYESMYRSMQSMRGMGWMWTPNSAVALPDAQSPGAQLVAKYCSQCHAAPSPTLHTNAEWSAVTSRMREHMHDMSVGAKPDLKMPSAPELYAITEYLGKHAAAAH